MLPARRLLYALLAGLPLAVVPVLAPVAWVAPVALWTALLFGVGYDAAVLFRARPSAKLAVPRRAGVGTSPTLEVSLAHRAPFRLTMRVRPELTLPLEGASDTRVAVPPAGLPAEMRISAPKRGRGSVRAVWVETTGPLGLLARIDRYDDGASEVAVVPDVARVARMTIEHLGADPMLGGLRRERWAGEGGEFESLQSYVPGMDPRGVDWKASARHQSLRVRRYHLERRQRLVLSIDTGRAMRDPIEGLERLDHAIHTALMLGRAALVAGDLVGLHAYGSRPIVHLPPKSGAAQIGRLQGVCAELEAEADETNHVLGLRDLLVRLDRRTMVVVFTEFQDLTTAELMIETIGHLARKHLVVFVALDDPVLEEPLEAFPREPEDLASAVVAAGLAERRRQVLARLERLGVHAIHARPGRAAHDLLDRYLEIKRRRLIG